jgi:uncharacterized protein (TIGR00369 family)
VTDAVVDRFARMRTSPVSRLLGFRVTGWDADRQTLTATFHATTEMVNAIGTVQGGLVSAMLDLAMSAAAFAASDFRLGVPTLEMKTSYLAPGRPGILTAEGSVLRMGKSVVFLEGRIRDADGVLLATASSTTRVFERTDVDVF